MELYAIMRLKLFYIFSIGIASNVFGVWSYNFQYCLHRTVVESKAFVSKFCKETYSVFHIATSKCAGRAASNDRSQFNNIKFMLLGHLKESVVKVCVFMCFVKYSYVLTK